MIGFDDIPIAAHISPPLTTFRSDNVGLAATALLYLAEFLNNPEAPPQPPPAHKHDLVVRRSTAAPGRR